MEKKKSLEEKEPEERKEMNKRKEEELDDSDEWTYEYITDSEDGI